MAGDEIDYARLLGGIPDDPPPDQEFAPEPGGHAPPPYAPPPTYAPQPQWLGGAPPMDVVRIPMLSAAETGGAARLRVFWWSPDGLKKEQGFLPPDAPIEALIAHFQKSGTFVLQPIDESGQPWGKERTINIADDHSHLRAVRAAAMASPSGFMGGGGAAGMGIDGLREVVGVLERTRESADTRVTAAQNEARDALIKSADERAAAERNAAAHMLDRLRAEHETIAAARKAIDEDRAALAKEQQAAQAAATAQLLSGQQQGFSALMAMMQLQQQQQQQFFQMQADLAQRRHENDLARQANEIALRRAEMEAETQRRRDEIEREDRRRAEAAEREEKRRQEHMALVLSLTREREASGSVKGQIEAVAGALAPLGIDFKSLLGGGAKEESGEATPEGAAGVAMVVTKSVAEVVGKFLEMQTAVAKAQIEAGGGGDDEDEDDEDGPDPDDPAALTEEEEERVLEEAAQMKRAYLAQQRAIAPPAPEAPPGYVGGPVAPAGVGVPLAAPGQGGSIGTPREPLQAPSAPAPRAPAPAEVGDVAESRAEAAGVPVAVRKDARAKIASFVEDTRGDDPATMAGAIMLRLDEQTAAYLQAVGITTGLLEAGMAPDRAAALLDMIGPQIPPDVRRD